MRGVEARAVRRGDADRHADPHAEAVTEDSTSARVSVVSSQ